MSWRENRGILRFWRHLVVHNPVGRSPLATHVDMTDIRQDVELLLREHASQTGTDDDVIDAILK